MKLRFELSGADENAKSVMSIMDIGSRFWVEPLVRLYPELSVELFCKLSPDGKLEYLHDFFAAFAQKNAAELAEKPLLYASHWAKFEPQIIDALEERFGLKLGDLFNDLTAQISLNPVTPRFLEQNTFEIFHMNSERGALGIALHEIIHFVWFFVWNRHFGDSYAEYEQPSLKWILSEMVVETVMRDERLGSINPYFEHKQCVYPYFYTLELNNRPILDILHELSKTDIFTFMEQSYRLLQDNEYEIRAYIAEAEAQQKG